MEKKKLIIIVIVVIALGIGGYMYWKSKQTESESGNGTSEDDPSKITKDPEAATAIPESEKKKTDWVAESFPLSKGMKGDNVSKLQDALSLGNDGKFGAGTEATLENIYKVKSVSKALFDTIVNQNKTSLPTTKSTIGRTLKSRGYNVFDSFSIVTKNKDVKQPDGTFKRLTTNIYSKNIIPQVFIDGSVVGKVKQVTNAGFYLETPSNKIVWASKNLLTS
jgi:hypothetical protein